MMDDEEDVKKLTDFLKSYRSREELQTDFVESDCSDDDDDEEESSDENLGPSESFSSETTDLPEHSPIACLNQEEKQIIDSCQDPELKNILSLNRQKYIQLTQLYAKFKEILKECQKNIAVAKELHAQSVKYSISPKQSLLPKIGCPYFKEKNLFPCQPNEDTLEKQRNWKILPYDFDSFHCRWKYSECRKLTGAVKINYNYNKTNFIKKEIALKEKRLALDTLDKSQIQHIQNEIDALRKDLKYYKDNTEVVPPINDNEFIDWIRISTVFFQGKRSDNDCRLFWKNYLHPDINKSAWSSDEKNKLATLAKKYNYQNWDKINEELNTNRNAFLVFHFFVNNIYERFKQSEFTNEEDERLLKFVNLYKVGNHIPWPKIVPYMKDRSRVQLRCRYKYLEQYNKQLGKFSKAEDVLLLILVDRYGMDFAKCSEYFPNRTREQLNSHFKNSLSNLLKTGQFSVKEDKEIVEYVNENGHSWASLAKKLNRNRNLVRQRYLTIKKYLQTNPERKIEEVPRRKAPCSNSSNDLIRIVADEFRNNDKLPSLAEIRQLLRRYCIKEDDNDYNDVNQPGPSHSSNYRIEDIDLQPGPSRSSNYRIEDIDSLLIDFFCTSIKTKAPNKVISAQNLKVAVDNVKEVLKMFKVKLEIPNNFEENKDIDATDVGILNNLIKSTEYNTKTESYILVFNHSNSQNNFLIAPNIYTCACLRSLIIKYQKLNKPNDKLITLDQSEMDLQKKQLFYERFHLMLKWPSILSLLEPIKSLVESATQNKQVVVKKTYIKKSAKRAKLI